MCSPSAVGPDPSANESMIHLCKDPQVSLVLNRLFSVQWVEKQQQQQGAASGASEGKKKKKKKFDKLAISRRSSSALDKADQFWDSCRSHYQDFLQGNNSAPLQSLQDKLDSNEAQHIFQAGDFQILEKIGQGGWGVVYKAVHVATGHVVALKELDPKCSSVETQGHRRLPLDCGVVPCYGTFPAMTGHANADTDDPDHNLRTWIILKLCERGSLCDRLMRDGPLSPKEAAFILKRVSEIATFLHTEHGIVHNDLKPANVLFDEDGAVLLCDLGVAQRGEWQTERLGGTFSHMSPEKLTARKLARGRYSNHEKIDVWALGVMLYEMLFLIQPFPTKPLTDYPTSNGDPSDADMIMDLKVSVYKTMRSVYKKYQAPLRDPFLTDLLQGLLHADALQRPTLASIKKHPWIKQFGKWTERLLMRREPLRPLLVLPSPPPPNQPKERSPNKLDQPDTHTTIANDSFRRRISEIVDHPVPGHLLQVLVSADC